MLLSRSDSIRKQIHNNIPILNNNNIFKKPTLFTIPALIQEICLEISILHFFQVPWYSLLFLPNLLGCGVTVADVRPRTVQQGTPWTPDLVYHCVRRACRLLSSKYLAIIYSFSLPGCLPPPSFEDHHLRFRVPVTQIPNAGKYTHAFGKLSPRFFNHFFFFLEAIFRGKKITEVEISICQTLLFQLLLFSGGWHHFDLKKSHRWDFFFKSQHHLEFGI